MSWDNLPGTGRGDIPRLSLAEALRGEFPDVVVVDSSVAKGRAYLAVRSADGQVRPVYLWLERDPTSGEVFYKDIPVDESPARWPRQVTAALTTWEL